MPALYRIRQATADDIDDLLRQRQVMFDSLAPGRPTSAAVDIGRVTRMHEYASRRMLTR